MTVNKYFGLFYYYYYLKIYAVVVDDDDIDAGAAIDGLLGLRALFALSFSIFSIIFNRRSRSLCASSTLACRVSAGCCKSLISDSSFWISFSLSANDASARYIY
jgi:hypothetical protein